MTERRLRLGGATVDLLLHGVFEAFRDILVDDGGATPGASTDRDGPPLSRLAGGSFALRSPPCASTV